MYYGLIMISVIMFGCCFKLSDIYRSMRGNSFKISLQFSVVSSFAGLIVLLVINKLKLEFTVFTFIIAFLNSLVGLGFTFCSLKALESINLSLFSLFSMLGGMALPFLQGIIFYGEKVTLAKILCFIIICVALLMTIEKGEKNRGTIYYIGIFVLNGMSGVLSKFFVSSSFTKTSSAGYSILSALILLVISVTLLLIFFKKKDNTPKASLSSICVGISAGGISKIANFLLIIALSQVDASVQFPMVTGGVMIVSTIIGFFAKKKPSKKDILSVTTAFIGMLILFSVPV